MEVAPKHPTLGSATSQECCELRGIGTLCSSQHSWDVAEPSVGCLRATSMKANWKLAK